MQLRWQETGLEGSFLLELEPAEDERGFFARTFCRDEFAARGLVTEFAQTSISFNHLKGTLRGMHLQASPHEEAKLVRCTRGRIFDAIVDLRTGSPTYLKAYTVDLSAENHAQLYVPAGFAHGFQTLEDESEVLYQISVPFVPEASRGYHHASLAFGIDWPLPPENVSTRDHQLEKLARS